MQTCIRSIVLIAAIPFFSVGCSKPVSFNKDVKPILAANCLICHDGSGEGSAASGFSVKTYDDVMKGTKYGPVIVPGSSVSSTLYRVIAHKVDPKIQMPPHHDERLAKGREDELTPRQITTIEMWIDQGAKNN
ncbi:MAG: c-type cytochrome domain-containing protein [Gammaproteobacteria bacterium]